MAKQKRRIDFVFNEKTCADLAKIKNELGLVTDSETVRFALRKVARGV